MTYPGFINAENLLSDNDRSIATRISTWEKAENWELWKTSKVSQDIFEEVSIFLVEEPKITTYMIMPTVRWVG